ncbi:hypothetical protein ACU4GA_12945 [Methylobacterium oryzae CBMB20]
MKEASVSLGLRRASPDAAGSPDASGVPGGCGTGGWRGRVRRAGGRSGFGRGEQLAQHAALIAGDPAGGDLLVDEGVDAIPDPGRVESRRRRGRRRAARRRPVRLARRDAGRRFGVRGAAVENALRQGRAEPGGRS